MPAERSQRADSCLADIWLLEVPTLPTGKVWGWGWTDGPSTPNHIDLSVDPQHESENPLSIWATA